MGKNTELAKEKVEEADLDLLDVDEDDGGRKMIFQIL